MIEVIGVSKRFDDNIVLSDFSATFHPGITCITGVSGRGKTTLLNIMMGLLRADSGYIIGLDGKHVSAVFQEDRLCERLNAIDNVRLVCPGDVTRETIEEYFEVTGLVGDSLTRPVSELSGGMKRRVAIVRALLAAYDVILMDEPFKGLDEKTKKTVISLVRRETEGKITIIVTHDKDEISALGARVLEMR